MNWFLMYSKSYFINLRNYLIFFYKDRWNFGYDNYSVQMNFKHTTAQQNKDCLNSKLLKSPDNWSFKRETFLNSNSYDH